MRRFLLVLFLTAAGLSGPWAPPASACSCASYDVRERLPEVDGAFVGRLLAREEPSPVGGRSSSATPVRYRFGVERRVKGDIPSPTIDVWASASGASCGLETPPGERVGLLVDRDDARWISNLCMQVEPDVLIRAGQPLPPPDGVPPPAVVVGTTHGPGRVLSLDGQGRIVAFGDGAGNVSDIAFCPGGALLAEAFSTPNEGSYHNPGVAIRTVADLTVTWERFVGPGGIVDVACREQGAGEVLAIVVEEIYSDTAVRYESRVLLFGREGDARVLWHGEASGGTFSADGTSAFLSSGPDGRQLLHVGLADFARPAVTTVAHLPAHVGTMAVSPDGRHLAAVTTSPPWSSPDPPPLRAVVVDLAAAPAGVVEAPLAAGPAYAPLWSGADRVVFAPAWAREPVRIFDTALNEIASWSGWSASSAAVVGDQLVGLTAGVVVTAPLLTGPPAQWADLESGVPGTVVAFPGGAPVSRSASPSSTTTTATAPAAEPTGAPAVASLPGGSGSGTGGRMLLAGGAGAAILAAVAAGLVHRRRPATLPPLRAGTPQAPPP